MIELRNVTYEYLFLLELPLPLLDLLLNLQLCLPEAFLNLGLLRYQLHRLLGRCISRQFLMLDYVNDHEFLGYNQGLCNLLLIWTVVYIIMIIRRWLSILPLSQLWRPHA